MKTSSIKKNYLMNILLTLSTFIYPIITFPYVSRILLPSGTGRIAFATSLISYFNMFAQLGIPTYGVRVCAKIRDDKKALTKTAHELLMINVMMGLLAYSVLAISIVLVPRLYQDKKLILIVSSMIWLSAIGMEWLYRGLEQYTYITVCAMLFKVMGIIAMFALIHSKADYPIYGGISVFAASGSGIMNFFHARKYISFKPVGNYNLKRHFRVVLVFFAMACATTIYTHLDVVMMGMMTSNTDVGYYNAAVKVKSLLVSAVTALGTVLLPRASYYIEHNQLEQFRQVSQKALRFILMMATPLVVYFIAYAKEGILLLSGGDYINATAPMRIIMPTVLFIGLTNILGIQILVPMGREKVVLRSEIAGAVTDLILNALLIPFYQASGAAIGTLAAEIVVFLVQYHALRGMVRSFFMSYHWGRLALGISLSLGACFWIKWMGLHLFFSLLISGMLFFAVYFLFMLWSKEEIVTETFQLVRKKIGRIRRNESD